MSEPIKRTESRFNESWPIGLLQACPRCGNETHNYLTQNESLWFDDFTAGCYRCNHSENRERWNLRPVEHKLEQQIAQLTKERDELAAQLKEQSRHIRCIYCNEKYTAEESGELADHILSCEKSPLVQMNAELMEVANLLIGSSDTDSVIIEAEKRIKSLPENPILKQRDDALEKLRLSESQVHTLLAERESVINDTDEEWLAAIGTNYSFSFGKPWETKDGETREEGLQSNIAALFQIIESARNENDQLAAKCASMVEGAELYEDAIQHQCLCVSHPEQRCEQCEIVVSARKRFHDQCGVGWLSPEKKKVLVEALEFAANAHNDSKGSIELGQNLYEVSCIAKQALEVFK